MALDYTKMAEEMEKAMDQEWFTLFNEHLPANGLKDRKILFKAIARGMLRYLESQQNQMINRLTLDPVGYGTSRVYDVITLDLNTMSGT